MKHIRRYILLVVLLGLALPTLAQPGTDPKNRLEIISTDVFEFGEFDGLKVRKLIGNVHLMQDSTEMFCDSAYHYVDSNYVIAYSNVRIILSRALGREVKGNKLTYDGEKKIVNIYNNVILKDSSVTLYTNHLTYYRIPDYGYYQNGGKIVNGENVMYSKSGYYYPKEEMTYFRDEVLLVNPDFLLETDTLGYQTEREIAYFLAPTYIYDSLNYIYTEDGFYDTKLDMAYSYLNSQIGDTSYTLYADTIIYNENKDLGEAFGDVMVQEADTGLTLFGQYGQFKSKTEESVLTDQAFAIQIFDEDTLYLFADTLYSVKDTVRDQKVFYAYYQALFFMKDIQGTCDSITYLYEDSLLYFDKKPVLWSDSTQITGTSIMAGLNQGDIDTLAIPKNAFIVSQEGSAGYNQIKGKAMNAKFKENKMDKMWVWGNSESIYFTKDEQKGGYIGMNNAKCTDMFITFKDNEPNSITFIDQPTGSFLPMYEVVNKPNKLEGFTWHEDDRPIKPDWLFDIIYPERDTLLTGLDSIISRLSFLQERLDSTYDFVATSPEGGEDSSGEDDDDGDDDDSDDDDDGDEGDGDGDGDDDNEDGDDSDDGEGDDGDGKPTKGRKTKDRKGEVTDSDSTNTKPPKVKKPKKEKTFKNPKAELKWRLKQKRKAERLERRIQNQEKRAQEKANKPASKQPKNPDKKFSLRNFFGLQGRKLDSEGDPVVNPSQSARAAKRAKRRAEKLKKVRIEEGTPTKGSRGGATEETPIPSSKDRGRTKLGDPSNDSPLKIIPDSESQDENPPAEVDEDNTDEIPPTQKENGGEDEDGGL